MAPAEFSLRLQHGITGGFAPPTPSAIHTITSNSTTSSLFINSAVRPSGTPSLLEQGPKTLAHDDSTQQLVEELVTILKSIPVESPPGSQDIYGLDTSIAFGSEEIEWINGGPQGCGGGESEVQPTEEQKAKFRRAVEIVNQLVGKAQ